VLKETGIESRSLSDYVASLSNIFPSGWHALAGEWLDRADSICQRHAGGPAAARRRRKRFLIRAHIGNYSLFVSGSSRIAGKSRESRSPDLSFYERHGPSNYRAAAGHKSPARLRRQRVGQLAEISAPSAAALNRLSDTCFISTRPRGPRSSPRENDVVSDIQRLFERTYAAAGVNLEDCLIDRHRCGQLSVWPGAQARELSDLARTFLRRIGDDLHIGISYSQWLIEESSGMIRGAASAMQTSASSSPSWRNQSRAPRCARLSPRGAGNETRTSLAPRTASAGWILIRSPALRRFFRRPAGISRTSTSRWLRFHLSPVMPEGYSDPNLRGRYAETTQLAKHYTACLDASTARGASMKSVFSTRSTTRRKSSTSSR